MTLEKVFCEECRNDVEFTVVNESMNGTVKGETYTYLGKVAHCTDCGSEVYVSDVNDYNLRVLYDMYREKHGIISLDSVLKIPGKYAIGKRPISLLLGWGELTFSRYCDGDVPTKQYSDILQKIYAYPEYYCKILEENKGNLKTESAYKKSRKAVDKLLNNIISEESKIDFAIEYLLNQCEDITPLALQKALYYIQGFYYAFNRTFLFSEDCQAWIHGPVYRDIYFRYKDYKFDPIKFGNEVDDSKFSSSEKAVLESVVKHICCYSGKVLEKCTHFETPWLTARAKLKSTEPSKEEIGKYFDSVREKYKMINPNDIKAYAETMFKQI